MSEVSRALEQIAEIHDHLARHEVYRGWRSAPVAASSVVGFSAAAWQALARPTADPMGFIRYWLIVAVASFTVACAEIAWRYVRQPSAVERRRSRRVFGQMVPPLLAGAAAATTIARLDPTFVAIVPGLLSLFFGAAIAAAAPYLLRASRWVAAYYGVAGLALLVTAAPGPAPSPWSIGGVFGVGQLLGALVLYFGLERERHVDA